MKKTILFILDFYLAAGGLASPSGHVQADLVAEVQSIRPGQPFWVGLRLRMAPHWHTYWRNPGDAGLATSIEWDLPEGFRASDIHWPYPKRLETPPLVSFVYENEVLLPVKITPPAKLQPGSTVTLKAAVDWLECKEACLPGNAKLQISLPVRAEAPQPDPALATAFAETRVRLPLRESNWRLTAVRTDTVIVLQMAPPPDFPLPLRKVEFFPYESDAIEQGRPQHLQQRDGAYRLQLAPSDMRTEPLQRLRGVLVAEPGWDAAGQRKALSIDVRIRKH